MNPKLKLELERSKPILAGLALALLAALMLVVAGKLSTNSQQHTAQKASASLSSGTFLSRCDKEKFDGRCLYDTTWQAFDQMEMYLAEPDARNEFAAWRHKFDRTGDLDCPDARKDNGFKCESLDRALNLMVNSIGQQFDYLFDVAGSQSVRDMEHSSLIGIGVRVGIKDVQSIIATLPKEANQAQAESRIMVGPGHELTVMEEPERDAPSFGILHEGDIILAVRESGSTDNPRPLNGLTMSASVALIRGPQNTSVELSIERAGTGTQETVTVRRAHVPRHAVHVRQIAGQATVIKIDDFEADTFVHDIEEALKNANQSKLPIVLDLRNNPGGLLAYGQRLIEALLVRGLELEVTGRVFGEGDYFNERQILHDNFKLYVLRQSRADEMKIRVGDRSSLLVDPKIPVGVLINGASASASEVVAGALQVNHRAVVVGTPSYLKDEVQHQVLLPYGRSAHIPTSVFMPGGRPVYEMVPDQEVAPPKDLNSHNQDPQLDRLVSMLEEQARASDERNLRAQQWAKERAEHRRQFVCIRNKQAELAPGEKMTEALVKTCMEKPEP
jgi:carboxyl-terminal processing protease